MKAYRFDTLDGLDALRLREEADPGPQRGEVLVRVQAVSLNFRDLAMPRGRYPRPCLPGLIPISDAAGEVVEVGEGVASFKVGDRVIGAFHPRWFGGDMPSTIQKDSYGAESDGWLCELKAISQEAVVRIPDSLSFEEAATLPCAGLTAWTALTGPTPIRAGRGPGRRDRLHRFLEHRQPGDRLLPAQGQRRQFPQYHRGRPVSPDGADPGCVGHRAQAGHRPGLRL